jgi:RNase adaptor protein for sRNA GlmZ degradation
LLFMQTGYVFLCSNASMTECMRSKQFSCSGKQVKVAQELEIDAVVFLLNAETGTLLGPFTVVKRSEDLEKGTWYSSMDEHSFSENIKVEWERLHELKNATDKIHFLKDKKECALSAFQTQELLTELRNAPLVL